MEEEKIPTRADIPDSDKWDLTHLFSDVGKWNEDVEWITRTYPRITEWKGRVAESPQTLAKVLEFEKELDLKIEPRVCSPSFAWKRIGTYSERRSDSGLE